MNSRGIVLVHDYNAWPGVRKGVDEFLLDKSELVIPMPDKSGSAIFCKILEFLTNYAFTNSYSSNESIGLTAKVSNLIWGIRTISKYRLPKRAFHFGGGLGDHLLCSAIFHELHKREITNCWMLSLS